MRPAYKANASLDLLISPNPTIPVCNIFLMATTARLASLLLRQQSSILTRQRGLVFTCQRPALWSSPSPWSRTLSTTPFRNAALAPTPPAQPTITISSPDPKYIEDEEIDVELPPPEEIRLEITDRAAEVCAPDMTVVEYSPLLQQLRAIATRQNDPDAALRVSIDSGGCHGYQYKLELATNHALDDLYVFRHFNICVASHHIFL